MWTDLLSGAAALAVDAPWRLWLLAPGSAVVVAAVWRAGGGRAVYASAALRLAAVALLVFAVAGLSLRTREEAQDLCIVLSADASSSVDGGAERVAGEIGRELAAKLRPSDQLGLIAFARQAEVVAWPSAPPRPPSAAEVKLDRSATRLASGIEAAVPLCPEGSERKIVLVTDGNETLGDARRAAELARQTDTRVYAVALGAGGDDGPSLEKLTAPPLVREGSVFPVRALVRNGGAQPRSATIEVLVDGQTASRAEVRLDPGINVFEIPYQLHEKGSYRLAARLAGDGASREQRREMSLAVAGPVRALVVGRSRDSALAKALQLREVAVEFREPAGFPKLEDLLQFHCVIFDDVARKELSDAALEALESYVKDFGGGFLMTGGARSFGDKGYQKSAVERVLPVHLIEQEQKPKGRPPIGVFLLVDRSNSMSYNSRRHDMRDGEKMKYARAAALALVEQLRPEDRIGVIAFDSDPYVLGPLRPLSEQRSVLEDRISRLVPGGGTDFKAAMEIATAQLVQSGLKTLHVILLTDGDTNRGAADHVAVTQAMARLGISVTTVRIGDDDVNLAFLEQISQDTGGRFYHVEDIELLPQLIVNDTRQARGDKGEGVPPVEEKPGGAPLEGPRRPDIGEATEVVRGLSARELPVVRSVPQSKLKNGADLVLYVGAGTQKLPLLATWQYGLGRAAAFPLDPAQPDAAIWSAWPGFAKLWSQLVRWAIREEAPWETKQSVRLRDGTPFLEVQTFDDLAGGIDAQVFLQPDRPLEVALTPVAPRLFRAPLPPLPAGRYALLLTRQDAGHPVQKREMLTVDASTIESADAEQARRLPDLDLLREISTETGGSLNPTNDELLARHGASHAKRHRLDGMLVVLALSALLADMALRMRAEP
ncbi:MAG: VWA domain-containing protein [Deltaproteobacteria bacterium]|nr:VWA domain-containing protein [Deltaproteobacteria bacterium]